MAAWVCVALAPVTATPPPIASPGLARAEGLGHPLQRVVGDAAGLGDLLDGSMAATASPILLVGDQAALEHQP